MSLREHPAVLRFVQAARTYCGLIETTTLSAETWAEAALPALAELYAAALVLPEPEVEAFDRAPDGCDVGFAEWQEHYKRLGELLGEARWYWCYFDPTEPPESRQEPVLGNLADDLADIYGDIKPGLRAWDTGEESYIDEVVYHWKFPLFGSHWGVHAVGALRALHPLVFLRGLVKEQDEAKSNS
jgi:hypothetical protein